MYQGGEICLCFSWCFLGERWDYSEPNSSIAIASLDEGLERAKAWLERRSTIERPVWGDKLPVETGAWADGNCGSSLSDVDPGASLEDSSMIGDCKAGRGGSIWVDLTHFALLEVVWSFFFPDDSEAWAEVFNIDANFGFDVDLVLSDFSLGCREGVTEPGAGWDWICHSTGGSGDRVVSIEADGGLRDFSHR